MHKTSDFRVLQVSKFQKIYNPKKVNFYFSNFRTMNSLTTNSSSEQASKLKDLSNTFKTTTDINLFKLLKKLNFESENRIYCITELRSFLLAFDNNRDLSQKALRKHTLIHNPLVALIFGKNEFLGLLDISKNLEQKNRLVSTESLSLFCDLLDPTKFVYSGLVKTMYISLRYKYLRSLGFDEIISQNGLSKRKQLSIFLVDFYVRNNPGIKKHNILRHCTPDDNNFDVSSSNDQTLSLSFTTQISERDIPILELQKYNSSTKKDKNQEED